MEYPIGPCAPIAQNIYLYTPPTPPTALIILCTWLGGASPRRIAKYTAGYAKLFPTAVIVLITTTIAEITVRSFAAVKEQLEPARGVISQFFELNSDGGDTGRPVLLHIFSHGGSNIGTQLMRSIREDSVVKHDRFVSALRLVIFDCCPGDSAFIRQYNAAAVSLPPATTYPIRNLLGRAVLYPSIGLLSILQAAGVMSDVEGLRAELNDPGLFGSSARRFYVYSVEDEMVRWEDVERHMEDGRGRGFLVQGEKFGKGEHCALVMLDEERYWESIRRAWEGEEERSARESRL
jgi:DNA repair protein RAD57